MGNVWTNKETRLLRNLFDKGVPDSVIAEHLGRTATAVKSKRKKARIIGDPSRRRYTVESKNRMRKKPKGEKSPKWKGGRRLNHNGYIEIFDPAHHRARGNGYVFEHILVAEKALGRKLYSSEIVHHMNGIKTDNEIKNLSIMTRNEHSSYHGKSRLSSLISMVCPVCGKSFMVKPSHINNRKTCSVKCASVLFRLFFKGKPRDYIVPDEVKAEVLNNVKRDCITG